MPDAIDPKLYDQRVAQRYIRKGLLDEKEYRRYLDSLPDRADQAVEVDATFEPSAAPHRVGTPLEGGPGSDTSEE